MTLKQREALHNLLKSGPLDLGAPLETVRPLFEKMMAMTPLAEGTTSRPVSLGGVSGIATGNRELLESGAQEVILYFHGGAFVVGSAHSSLGLASELSRRSHIMVISVDYRLAPEHPFPAAIDDALTAYKSLLTDGCAAEHISLFGEYAGGNLAASLLLAIKDAGLPMPASAVLVSPWTNLQLTGASITTKAAADPSLTAAALHTRAADYLGTVLSRVK